MRGGFSLMEMVVVVALISILSVIAVTNLIERAAHEELDAATTQIATTLREAQSKAATQEGGTSWGVHFENSTATPPFYALYKDPYSTGSVVLRKSLSRGVRFSSSSIPFGGFSNILFAQITGTPSAPALIELELIGGEGVEATSSVMVSVAGLVSF